MTEATKNATMDSTLGLAIRYEQKIANISLKSLTNFLCLSINGQLDSVPNLAEMAFKHLSKERNLRFYCHADALPENIIQTRQGCSQIQKIYFNNIFSKQQSFFCLYQRKKDFKTRFS